MNRAERTNAQTESTNAPSRPYSKECMRWCVRAQTENAYDGTPGNRSMAEIMKYCIDICTRAHRAVQELERSPTSD